MVGQSALGACRLGWNAMLKSIEAAANRRAAEAQLRQMSDRELADLGLGRSGIEFAVRTEADPPRDRLSVAAAFSCRLRGVWNRPKLQHPR